MKKLQLLTIEYVLYMVLFGMLYAGELSGDIDHDGKIESIQWHSIDRGELGEYFSLRVMDDDGSILWEGPRQKDINNPYIFASLDTGISLPELLMDIDGDNQMELLAPVPQSDVSATYFRALRWNGKNFEKLPSCPLMMDTAHKDRFIWMEGEHIYGTWVAKFGETQRGLVKAEVTHYDSEGNWKSGTAWLRFTPQGAVVTSWIKPLLGEASEKDKETQAPNATPSQKKIDINLLLSIRYTDRALQKLKRTGEKVKIGVIVDQYGTQYMEEEGIAAQEYIIDAGINARLESIALRDPSYTINPNKRYMLTVMITSARKVEDSNLLECIPNRNIVGEDINTLKNATVTLTCKLLDEPNSISGKNIQPANKEEAIKDPFADIDEASLLN